MKRFFSWIAIIFSFVLFAASSPVTAQESITNPSSQQLKDYYTECDGYVSYTGECGGANVTVSSVGILACGIWGYPCPIDPDNPLTSHNKNFQKSAIGFAMNTISSMYQAPPADFALWVQDTGQTLGFITKPAYAQGAGFAGLAPMLSAWKAFRNMAYLLIAVGLVVIGFMVMFRKKIDPKTVVTVQNALPRLIMTLVLITFSYAIVGLLIDFMYIILLFAYSIFEAASPNTAEFANRCGIFTVDFFQMIVKIFQGQDPRGACYATRDIILNGNLFQAFNIIFPGNIVQVAQVGGDIIGVEGPLAFILSPITGFIFGLILLLLFIRLIFVFLGAYIQIILGLVFGPLQIVMNIFPGNETFMNWLKNIIANLSVFVVAGIMFLLSIFFQQSVVSSAGQLWTPPYLLIFGSTQQAIKSLFALGVLMAIPTIAGQIKEALKSKGQPGLGVLGSSLGQAGGLGMQMYHFWTSHQTQKYLKEQAKLSKPTK